MTSYPLVSLTLATLRIAELGFLGVVVYTRVQTPRFCGHCSKCCDLDLLILGCLGLRISCCIVGIQVTPYISIYGRTTEAVQLKIALRVRNTKNRNRLNIIERRGGLSEDLSKSLDLAHSNSEATSRRPSTHVRVRIGLSGFDVNTHLVVKIN